MMIGKSQTSRFANDLLSSSGLLMFRLLEGQPQTAHCLFRKFEVTYCLDLCSGTLSGLDRFANDSIFIELLRPMIH